MTETTTAVSAEQQAAEEALTAKVLASFASTLDAPLNSVRVLVNEVDPELWTVGTTLKSEERTDNPTP